MRACWECLPGMGLARWTTASLGARCFGAKGLVKVRGMHRCVEKISLIVVVAFMVVSVPSALGAEPLTKRATCTTTFQPFGTPGAIPWTVTTEVTATGAFPYRATGDALTTVGLTGLALSGDGNERVGPFLPGERIYVTMNSWELMSGSFNSYTPGGWPPFVIALNGVTSTNLAGGEMRPSRLRSISAPSTPGEYDLSVTGVGARPSTAGECTTEVNFLWKVVVQSPPTPAPTPTPTPTPAPTPKPTATANPLYLKAAKSSALEFSRTRYGAKKPRIHMCRRVTSVKINCVVTWKQRKRLVGITVAVWNKSDGNTYRNLSDIDLRVRIDRYR
jgi:hypothetical protein